MAYFTTRVPNPKRYILWDCIKMLGSESSSAFIGNSSWPLIVMEMTEKKPRPWRPTNRQALWAIGLVVALVTITLLIAGLYPDIWQALSTERVMLIGIGVALVAVIVLLAIGGASLRWTGFADKTLWEWLQLLGALAIPVVLAIAGFWFTSQQEARQQRIEDQRAQQAQKIENQRAEAERELAEQRAQDEALQAYLDQMSSLLLEKDLRQSEGDSEVRTLARARTLTVISRLDPTRKVAVMEFLSEADLVGSGLESNPIISLSGADLSEANLNGAFLVTGAQLAKARSLEGATMPDGQTLQSDTKPNRPTFKEWLKEGDTKPKVPDVLKDQ
jgi:hypothetical protein